MFQPEAKYEFVKRYCSPEKGWITYVDIDASEEGRTGGKRKTLEAKARQIAMQKQGQLARERLNKLGVTVGGSRKQWSTFVEGRLENEVFLTVQGDRDIVAVHPQRKWLIVAEVEGVSTAQPESKLYRAIGQTVFTASSTKVAGLNLAIVVVVVGDKIGAHLRTMTSLAKLGIAGVILDTKQFKDEWCINAHVLDGIVEL